MKRKGHISKDVATQENFWRAFYGYSEDKHGRWYVKRFEANLDDNLRKLLLAYATCSHRTSPYSPKEVFEPKHRIVHRSPVSDHVIQWAALLPMEKWLFDTIYSKCPACVPGKGTHYFFRQERHDLISSTQDEVYYYVQLDIHHYFEYIDHGIMSDRIHRKIKDPVQLHFLDEFIYSFHKGLPLGVKLSQALSGLYLAPFDRIALRCFGIADNPDKFNYWQDRYVTDSFLTCRTQAQADELAGGVEYMKSKFAAYVSEGLRHYSRFADNIIIKHRDKTFLHLMTELAIMHLSRDFLLEVNRGWNVRPMWMGNDICGYVFYHDHVRLRKRNKKRLCRQVVRLRKKGYADEDIRLKCASRIGFAQHADTKNLIRTLNMEKRLGTVIKNRKRKAPFEGMEVEQKLSIESLVCSEADNENDKLIQLIDYKIDDSVIERNDDGSPKQRIAIRYRKIDHVVNPGTDNPEYVWEEEEHYSFSGSKIMIDQAEQDFTREDLPLATVIREFTNKHRKKFYKFT